jgi:hypothetical protein
MQARLSEIHNTISALAFSLPCLALPSDCACIMAPTHNSRYTLPAFFLFLGMVQSQACYWPDGTAAGSSYAPCPSSNGTGPCCYDSGPSLSDLCYSNGFCYSVVLGKIYRGACTDQSWNRGAGCASQCLNSTYLLAARHIEDYDINGRKSTSMHRLIFTVS